ncbi:hypothetical protein Lal_00032182 [Lupinus albus]|nr:hypothetical protein Lal_00032182 [Lupinus albus]
MWYLGSGCSNQMTSDNSKFSILTHRDKRFATYRDSHKGKLLGVDRVGKPSSTTIYRILYIDDLKKYVKLLKNKKSLKISSIRSVHEGEFQNPMFREFYDEHGVTHNFTIANPHQVATLVVQLHSIISYNCINLINY